MPIERSCLSYLSHICSTPEWRRMRMRSNPPSPLHHTHTPYIYKYGRVNYYTAGYLCSNRLVCVCVCVCVCACACACVYVRRCIFKWQGVCVVIYAVCSNLRVLCSNLQICVVIYAFCVGIYAVCVVIFVDSGWRIRGRSGCYSRGTPTFNQMTTQISKLLHIRQITTQMSSCVVIVVGEHASGVGAAGAALAARS